MHKILKACIQKDRLGVCVCVCVCVKKKKKESEELIGHFILDLTLQGAEGTWET